MDFVSPRFCAYCGESIDHRRPQARTCGARCRAGLHFLRHAAPAVLGLRP